VLVHALVAAVGAGPEPAVFAFFDGADEVFTDFFRGGFGVAVFGEDDLPEFVCEPGWSVFCPFAQSLGSCASSGHGAGGS